MNTTPASGELNDATEGACGAASFFSAGRLEIVPREEQGCFVAGGRESCFDSWAILARGALRARVRSTAALNVLDATS